MYRHAKGLAHGGMKASLPASHPKNNYLSQALSPILLHSLLHKVGACGSGASLVRHGGAAS